MSEPAKINLRKLLKFWRKENPPSTSNVGSVKHQKLSNFFASKNLWGGITMLIKGTVAPVFLVSFLACINRSVTGTSIGFKRFSFGPLILSILLFLVYAAFHTKILGE